MSIFNLFKRKKADTKNIYNFTFEDYEEEELTENFIKVQNQLFEKVEDLLNRDIKMFEIGNGNGIVKGKYLCENKWIDWIIELELDYFQKIDFGDKLFAKTHVIVAGWCGCICLYLCRPEIEESHIKYMAYLKFLKNAQEVHLRTAARVDHPNGIINLSFLLAHWSGPELGNRTKEDRIKEAVELLEHGSKLGYETCQKKLEYYRKTGKLV